MAQHQVTVPVTQVEAVAFTITERFAVTAHAAAHPLAVAVLLKTVFPHIPKTILVNIALMHIAADTRTARNTAITQHRRYLNTRTAIKV